MVPFITAYKTEQGLAKQANQDALMIKTARTKNGQVGLFVVCDGMGGLSEGEIASKMLVEGLANWFEQTLPILLQSDQEDIPLHLTNKIEHLNQQLIQYGEQHQLKMGSTLTAIFIINQSYYTFQVGDSRAYLLSDDIYQLTKDQTLVAREVERGMITLEEAKSHPKKHVLLQCIGIQSTIEVVKTSGLLTGGELLLLCTDGFYQKLTEREIKDRITTYSTFSKENMESAIMSLVQNLRDREETDDITAVLVKIV